MVDRLEDFLQRRTFSRSGRNMILTVLILLFMLGVMDYRTSNTYHCVPRGTGQFCIGDFNFDTPVTTIVTSYVLRNVIYGFFFGFLPVIIGTSLVRARNGFYVGLGVPIGAFLSFFLVENCYREYSCCMEGIAWCCTYGFNCPTMMWRGTLSPVFVFFNLSLFSLLYSFVLTIFRVYMEEKGLFLERFSIERISAFEKNVIIKTILITAFITFCYVMVFDTMTSGCPVSDFRCIR